MIAVFYLLGWIVALCAILAPAAWLADKFGPKE